MSKSLTHIAALAFEIAVGADGIATEAHLLPPGPFRASDGRPFDVDAWQLDAAIAAQIMARLSAKANATLIDYEHQSLNARDNGQPAPAAGWFQALQWRDGKGLYAVDIAWTDAAKSFIGADEYRYISTVFFYRADTGEVLDIVSAALTNTPALDGLDSLSDQDLAALSARFISPPAKEPKTMKPEEQLAALTHERDTLTHKLAALSAELDSKSTQLAALTAERDTLKTQLASLDAEKAQAALTAENDKKAALLAAASAKLPPALQEWAAKLSLADLSEYLEKAAPLSLTLTQRQGDASRNAAGIDLENPLALAQAATKYQAEQKQLGITVDDISAINHVRGHHV